MTHFYRFISSDELHTILANSFTNDVITSENSAMIHLFKESTPTIIANHKHHYALDMTDFFTGDFEKETLTKETAIKTLRGVVSEDYLIALEFDKDPTLYNLGWYEYDKNMANFFTSAHLPIWLKKTNYFVTSGNAQQLTRKKSFITIVMKNLSVSLSFLKVSNTLSHAMT